MDKSTLTLILLTSLLTSCMTMQSRSYENQPHNVQVLKSDSLNIDHIKPITYNVTANKTWQNSGLFVENGDVINVTASGSWSPAPALLAWSGPEGNSLWNVEVKGIIGGALMAKIGHHGHPFEIGLTQTFQAKDYGMLYFAMNDPFRYVFDNSGKVSADIFVDSMSGKPRARKPSGLKIVSYHYNDQTRQGSLSAHVGERAFAIRQRLIKKIGEIASSKNVALKAGSERLDGGSYELLGESTRNGILELKFRTLW